MKSIDYILTLLEEGYYMEAVYQIQKLWDAYDLRVEDLWAFNDLLPEKWQNQIHGVD